MMSQVKICTLLLVAVSHFCNAQYIPEAIKNSISETKANAPQRIVRNIMQDRKGNIWTATHEGVFRYDGKSFTNITLEVAPPRVDDGPENRFYAVIEDRDGNFWFASTDSGVYFYDGKSIRNFTTADGLPSNRVHEIYQDTAGNIWFGSMGGASRYDGKSFQNFITEQGLSNNNVTEIMQDKTGKLWFGTNGGIYTYNGQNFTMLKDDVGKAFADVKSIIQDKKGNIWVGSNFGLWRYDGTTFTKFAIQSIADVIEDKNGNIWTCSRERGFVLSRYEASSSLTKRTTIASTDNASPPILSVFEDSAGTIWFGSYGLYRYDGNTITHFVP